jgi:hypothetical protein
MAAELVEQIMAADDAFAVAVAVEVVVIVVAVVEVVPPGGRGGGEFAIGAGAEAFVPGGLAGGADVDAVEAAPAAGCVVGIVTACAGFAMLLLLLPLLLLVGSPVCVVGDEEGGADAKEGPAASASTVLVFESLLPPRPSSSFSLDDDA